MTNAQHTPGPWDNMADGTNVKAFNSGVAIAQLENIPCGVSSYKERQANAKLIAAAPELLEALKWTESWIVKHGLDKAELITGQWAEVPILGTIRAAIAKATGK